MLDISMRSDTSIQVLFCYHIVNHYRVADAKGQFTYWSARTFARGGNRGIRLDYFVCSDELRHNDYISRPGVLDSYILHEETVGVSDHCPVVLVISSPVARPSV